MCTLCAENDDVTTIGGGDDVTVAGAAGSGTPPSAHRPNTCSVRSAAAAAGIARLAVAADVAWSACLCVSVTT